MLIRFLLTVVLLCGAQAAIAQSLTERLGEVFGGASEADEILNPDDAFRYEVETADPFSIKIYWQIVDGYYLYRDKFKFSILDGPATLEQEKIRIPAGKMKEDPAFGKVEINIGEPVIELPVSRASNNATPVTLELRYQGCKDNSVCYPPIRKELSLNLPAFTSSAKAEGAGQNAAGVPQSEQDVITAKLKDGSLLLNLIAFFGFGVLLSLTPCVFPMIPILSGIIVGQGESITGRRAFMLSLSYVLAMALCYAVLGVIAGMFYINLQAAFQNPWLISLFSAVFVALAFSMFGFYELQLPAAIQGRLNTLSNRQSGGNYSGAAVMGALSAIIVGPCVAPPLAGALLYISQTGNAVFGGLNLFAMGLGFGVPLLIIGASAGSLLPRAGAWMESVKQVFGVVMLGVAIWFLERILPAQAGMLLWAVLFVVSAIFLGALDSMPEVKSWRGLWKGLGIIMLVYGIILIVGAASGSKNIFRPLQGLTASSAQSTHVDQQLPFKRIKSITDVEQELALADKQDRFVMLDFYADWCVTCIEMEEYTFSDGAVRTLLEDVILLQADVTANDAKDQALLKKFGIYGPPAILFFGPDAGERTAYRVVGFVKAEKFQAHLQALKGLDI